MEAAAAEAEIGQVRRRAGEFCEPAEFGFCEVEVSCLREENGEVR